MGQHVATITFAHDVPGPGGCLLLKVEAEIRSDHIERTAEICDVWDRETGDRLVPKGKLVAELERAALAWQDEEERAESSAARNARRNTEIRGLYEASRRAYALVRRFRAENALGRRTGQDDRIVACMVQARAWREEIRELREEHRARWQRVVDETNRLVAEAKKEGRAA